MLWCRCNRRSERQAAGPLHSDPPQFLSHSPPLEEIEHVSPLAAALKRVLRRRYASKGVSLLKLRKVELVGFKSFCEKTHLTFSGTGLSCIIGPNGCGKSNIADAISWVLGEQSHKSLRAERMADCIFNGTAKRPPMGLAEVTLTLVDPELAEAARRVLGDGAPRVGGIAPRMRLERRAGGSASDRSDAEPAEGATRSRRPTKREAAAR